MPIEPRAPNRVLDLAELDRPSFRRVLDRMDALLARENISYLHPGKRWEYPWALERAELGRGARVLDAGCGDSIFPVYLAGQGCGVTAVDLDFSGSLGDLHGVDIDYVRGDLTALPLEDRSFDAVFCISVIEHLPEERIPLAMRELRRVLRPGGRLLLTTDYGEDPDAEIWHDGPDRRFRVEWRIFDPARFERLILRAPGWEIEGATDYVVDWDTVRAEMREYHGYPYTAAGVALLRS